MKVEVKNLPNSEVELTITVPYEEYTKWQKKAIADIGKEVKIPGFRPGHVPEDIVKEKVSEEAIKMATLDYVFPQTYSKVVREKDIQVVARPEVDIKSEVEKEGDDFVYTAKVAIMPEAELGDYKKVKVARKPVKVTQANIDETVNMIMSRYAEWQDVDRAAKEGDRAEVAFEGFDEKGKSIPNTTSKNHPIVIGSKMMIPGFEDEIIGLKKGDEKEFDITFPKDYHAEAMKGKKVKFKITLNRLEEKKEQKLDKDLVKKITGSDQSVEEFKKLVEEDLEKEMEQGHKQEFENEVIEKLVKQTKVSIPQALIDQEIDYMVQEQKGRLKQQGLDWETFLKHSKKTEEEVRKDYANSAEDRIKARLCMQAVLKKEKIEASDKEVKDRVDEIVSSYPKEQQESIKKHYEQDLEASEYIRNGLVADKLFALFEK